MAESDQKKALRSLWLELAEKNIEHGVDWPYIVRTLFRDLDEVQRQIAPLVPGLRTEADRLRGIGAVSVALWMDNEADRLEQVLRPEEAS